ncbi:MAG: hypothetical protein IH624_07410 [Phycisphaerae bacterium]|nr:hypothetical protein [Phycisphaerae bacterium]
MARVIAGCLSVGLLIGSVAALAGCEAPSQTERMLVAANCSKRVAETPEQKEHLKSLPQRQLFRLKGDETVFFGYADAKHCGCMYIGDEDALRRYEELVAERRMAMERVLQPNFSGFSRRVWGPWDPL